MSEWDKLMGPAREALEKLIAEGDAMADRIEELEELEAMTEKLHFDDLTKITCPFGMLDDDTQQRLMDCDAVEKYTDGWVNNDTNLFWFASTTYRAKLMPKRLVAWVQYDEDNVGLHCESYDEANYCLETYGGYIYRIERDEDGGSPTIELVEVGGKDE